MGRFRRIMPAAAAALIAVCAGSPARAEPRDNVVPPEVAGLEVKERHKNQVPRDLIFRDQNGKVVALGEFFGKGRPVLLTFNYTNCPLLCHLQLQGLVDGLRDIEPTAGRDFELVTIVLDPSETPMKARATHARHMAGYRRKDADLQKTAEGGWHFLTGSESNIRAAADAVGFPYRYLPARNEFVHPPVVVFLTPEGVVADYLYGVQYETKDIEAKLAGVSKGAIGAPSEPTFLENLAFCFYLDPTTKSPSIMRIMRTGAILSALAIVAGLAWFWRREVRGRDRPAEG